MRLPEYTLKREIEVPDQLSHDVLKFPPGTLIFPFWNKDYIPEHHLEKLKESKKFRSKNEPNLIMCIIGTRWVVVEEDNIRKTEYI